MSGHTCSIRGYPGVSAVSLSGGALGRPAGWGVVRPAAVGLAPGATATSTLQIADPANFGSRCFLGGRPGHLPTAAGLRVYPPNQFVSKTVPYPFPACANAGPVYMHAGPVTAGLPK